jgi:nucleoside triphosphatase
MTQYPEPTVGALILNKENQVFLMKSPKWHGKYVIPGGHIEIGESAESALVREIKEETCLDINNIEFISFQELIYDPIFQKKKHFIFLDFSCKTESTEVKLNEEGESYIWTTIDQALTLDIEPYTRKTIENYLKKKV